MIFPYTFRVGSGIESLCKYSQNRCFVKGDELGLGNTCHLCEDVGAFLVYIYEVECDKVHVYTNPSYTVSHSLCFLVKKEQLCYEMGGLMTQVNQCTTLGYTFPLV